MGLFYRGMLDFLGQGAVSPAKCGKIGDCVKKFSTDWPSSHALLVSLVRGQRLRKKQKEFVDGGEGVWQGRELSEVRSSSLSVTDPTRRTLAGSFYHIDTWNSHRK